MFRFICTLVTDQATTIPSKHYPWAYNAKQSYTPVGGGMSGGINGMGGLVLNV